MVEFSIFKEKKKVGGEGKGGGGYRKMSVFQHGSFEPECLFPLIYLLNQSRTSEYHVHLLCSIELQINHYRGFYIRKQY